MSTHPLQWQAPEPLWARFAASSELAVNAPDQFRPAILRFASDDFMEQMLATLSRDPAHLGNLLARPETWRTPPAADATVKKDMVERIAVPSLMQSISRGLNLKRQKSALQPVESSTPVEEQKQARNLALKLYQPAHQRYYLVSASLVCRVAGLPDKAVAQGGAEQMGFVLRRLLPSKPGSQDSAEKREFAFIKDAQGPRWQAIAADAENAGRLAPGEELLPLFPLGYRDGLDHPRTLWTGLIPVGRREEYMGTTVDFNTLAPTLAAGQLQSLQPATVVTANTGVSARMTQFKMEVAEPWKNLVRSSVIAGASIKQPSPAGLSDSETPEAKIDRLYTLNLQWQMQSWLILLDFADFLAVHLPEVWNAVANGAPLSDPPLSPRRVLFDWLNSANMSTALTAALIRPVSKLDKPVDFVQKSIRGSLREALADIGTARVGLERTLKLYGDTTTNDPDWPDFHFLLAGLNTAYQADGPYQSLQPITSPLLDTESAPSAPANPVSVAANAAAEILDRLTVLVVRALDDNPAAEANAPEPPFALKLSKALKDTQGDVGWFVVRYVHMNKDCGPLHPPTLSEPTQRFQLASFFDFDAPARPIRITLPTDTTPAGMRKHQKNTAFVISDMLCGQIQRAKGLGLVDLVRSVLPWPLHKDLDVGDGGACSNSSGNIGMICSLSIPIITICALILLIIIVSLLDFIFRWLPYFIICFPVPGLKAKPGENP
jgi:hypothetical protein